MPGMRLVEEVEPQVSRRREVVLAENTEHIEDVVVEKVTTVPDSGPISRSRGSVVEVFPPEKTR